MDALRNSLTDSEIRREFGMRLGQLRTNMKLTQAEVASLIGVRPETISFIENGKSDARLTTIWRLITSLSQHPNAPSKLSSILFQGAVSE